jgi:hypothetical protein
MIPVPLKFLGSIPEASAEIYRCTKPQFETWCTNLKQGLGRMFRYLTLTVNDFLTRD